MKENSKIKVKKENSEKDKTAKQDKIKKYEEKIKEIEKEISELKDVKFKKKDTTYLDQMQEKINKEIEQSLKDKQNITTTIDELMWIKEKLEEKINELIKTSKNIKNEIAELEESINSNILIKEKLLQEEEIKLDIIELVHQVQEQIQKIIELNTETAIIEKLFQKIKYIQMKKQKKILK